MSGARGTLEAIAALLAEGPEMAFAAGYLITAARDRGSEGPWRAWLLLLDRGEHAEVLAQVRARLAATEAA